MKYRTLLIGLILCSCLSSKKILETGIEEIQFGSGGGFTGEVKTFILKADDTLSNKGEDLRKVDGQMTLKLFKQAQEMKDYVFKKPENLYSFITIKTAQKTNRIVWGPDSREVDKAIIKLYEELMALTKQI